MKNRPPTAIAMRQRAEYNFGMDWPRASQRLGSFRTAFSPPRAPAGKLLRAGSYALLGLAMLSLGAGVTAQSPPGTTTATEQTLLDRAWEDLTPAQTQQRIELLLRAIPRAVETEQFVLARQYINALRAVSTTPAQQTRLRLREALLAAARGNPQRALDILQTVGPIARADPSIRADFLFVQALTQRTMGQYPAAALSLLRRDALLAPPAQATNRRKLLDWLTALDSLQLQILREESTATPNDEIMGEMLRGWLDLSEIMRIAPPARGRGVRNWQARYPTHPAWATLNRHIWTADAPPPDYQNIALLLPLTSPFGTSARAFYQGFSDAHNQDSAPTKPAITVHDIGDNAALVATYARAARQQGADFLVGPLGRMSVNALLAEQTPPAPMLMVGAVPAAAAADNLYGISVSPEQEARQVARRAYADGLRQVGIVRGDSDWGLRVATAFADQWETLGGRVVETRAFPAGIADYSRIIRALFGLDRSRARREILSAQLNMNLQFTPRRRADLDFLFLAANAKQARLLAPQLRFFQAHDMPLYATSAVYSGRPDAAVDADLDGIIFGDMDWMLDAAVPPPAAPSTENADANTAATADENAAPEESELIGIPFNPDAPAADDAADELQAAAPAETNAAPPELTPQQRMRRATPYYHTELDRLYALGRISYRLIPALVMLRARPEEIYFSEAADLRVDTDGNVWRRLRWAQFTHGLPTPLPDTLPAADAGVVNSPRRTQ